MLINMFTGDLEYDREDVQKNVILVLKTAIPSALLAKEQDMAVSAPLSFSDTDGG